MTSSSIPQSDNRRTIESQPNQRADVWLTNTQPNPWAAKISVEKIVPSKAPGNVKAYVDIKFGEALTIPGFKIVQQRGQRPWVSVPQERSGDRFWNRIYIHDEQLKDAISEIALAAWEVYQLTGVTK